MCKEILSQSNTYLKSEKIFGFKHSHLLAALNILENFHEKSLFFISRFQHRCYCFSENFHESSDLGYLRTNASETASATVTTISRNNETALLGPSFLFNWSKLI